MDVVAVVRDDDGARWFAAQSGAWTLVMDGERWKEARPYVYPERIKPDVVMSAKLGWLGGPCIMAATLVLLT